MEKPILMLVDYRLAFWSSTRNTDSLCSLNVQRIRSELNSLGHEVEVLGFSDLDLSRKDLAGRSVIYTSSEDTGARYKRYIEAKIFGLRMLGALPIPEPELLLAHHDKVMMESVRLALIRDAHGQLATRTFGTLEEAMSSADSAWPTPGVIKPGHGAGSRGVMLISNRSQGQRAAKRLSRSFGLRESVVEIVRRRRHRNYVPHSLHRNGFVIQEFIPGLNGDYKVLRYGMRFYVLARANRPGDFRASGSGRLDYSEIASEVVATLLDAALSWSEAIGSPFCSLDIGYDESRATGPFLIEFQCVNFGPAAAEHSTGYYQLGNTGQWERIEEACNLEAVFAIATSAHIASRAFLANGR